jgi:hypothetical protein
MTWRNAMFKVDQSCLPNLWGSGWWSRIMCQGVWIGALSHVDLSRNGHIFAEKWLFNWTETDEDSLKKSPASSPVLISRILTKQK